MGQPGMAHRAEAISANLKMTEGIRALETAVDQDTRTVRMMAGSRHRVDRAVIGNEMTGEMNIRASRNTVDSRLIRVTDKRITRSLQTSRISRVTRIMQGDFRGSSLIRDRDRIRRRYTV